eukprot:5877717-Heterocapsa_arctica.AAC.1
MDTYDLNVNLAAWRRRAERLRYLDPSLGQPAGGEGSGRQALGQASVRPTAAAAEQETRWTTC